MSFLVLSILSQYSVFSTTRVVINIPFFGETKVHLLLISSGVCTPESVTLFLTLFFLFLVSALFLKV